MVAGSQFGTLLVKQVMQENGKSVAEAEDHLAWLNLVSNILGLVLGIGIGFLSDRFTIWKLMTVNNVFILSTWYIMWVDVNKNQIGYMYDIGYILS